MRRLALVALFSVLAAGQDWRFADPDATLLGVIRPQALLNSSLMAPAMDDAMREDPSAAAMFGMARRVINGVTEIRFSIRDNGRAGTDVIALVSGHMDESLLRTIAPDNAKIKRIDERTLLLSNGAPLAQAAARMAKTNGRLPRALAGTELLQENDVWFSGSFPENAVTSPLMAPGMKFRGVRLGVRVHEGMQAEINLDAATPAMARRLLEIAAAADAQQPTPYKGLLRSSLDGSVAHFALDVPQQLMLDAARERLSASLATQQPDPPMRPRHVIVIRGLDEGSREIPLQ